MHYCKFISEPYKNKSCISFYKLSDNNDVIVFSGDYYNLTNEIIIYKIQKLSSDMVNISELLFEKKYKQIETAEFDKMLANIEWLPFVE